jgi:hypothetical protein
MMDNVNYTFLRRRYEQLKRQGGTWAETDCPVEWIGNAVKGNFDRKQANARILNDYRITNKGDK